GETLPAVHGPATIQEIHSLTPMRRRAQLLRFAKSLRSSQQMLKIGFVFVQSFCATSNQTPTAARRIRR
ncbi:MAG: hypothetical protein ACREV0_12970, partial [Burkholderiales bacterium]